MSSTERYPSRPSSSIPKRLVILTNSQVMGLLLSRSAARSLIKFCGVTDVMTIKTAFTPILVADDHSSALQTVVTMLAPVFCVVGTASDGKAAV